MKVKLILIGKTDEKALEELIEKYIKRLSHYISFEMIIIPDIKNRKNLSQFEQNDKEGQLFMNHIKPGDQIVLLDERGKDLTSVDFSKYMQKQMNTGMKNLVFLVGGPYGFSGDTYAKANSRISLSKMTFSHQMVRLIFVEQLYRAMTILKGEPYHHK